MEKQAEIKLFQDQLSVVQSKIRKSEGVRDITDRVAASFHLGMVGSGGRNTAKLNRKKEVVLDETIEGAKVRTRLYAEERGLIARIKDIEENGPEKREASRMQKIQLNVQYWNSLKAGDTITLYTGNQITITKKNRKSVISETVLGKHLK